MFIVELISQNYEYESAKSMNFTDVKVSLDVNCLFLPNNDYDDYDTDDDDRFNTNSSEQLYFYSSSTTTLQSALVKFTEKRYFLHFQIIIHFTFTENKMKIMKIHLFI